MATTMKKRIARPTLTVLGTPFFWSQWTRGAKIRKAKIEKKTGTSIVEICCIPIVRITAAVLYIKILAGIE
jgi:hypothetical protein